MVCSDLPPGVVARKGQICLGIAVVIYGFTFVLLKYATSARLGPLSFNAGRFCISAVFLVGVNWVAAPSIPFSLPTPPTPPPTETEDQQGALRLLWLWGTICGLLNFIASALLQFGLQTVNANRAGFILGMYVVFVPLLEWTIPTLRRQITPRAWVAVLSSVVGLYLLSGCAEAAVCFGGAFGRGELLCFVSMLFWVLSLVCSDFGSKRADPVALTMVNFIVAAVLSAVTAWAVEPDSWKPPFRDLRADWGVLLVVGVLQASAFALTTVGQRYSTPTETALILSLETVATCLVGYALLGETLDAVELLGCGLMLAATALATTDASVGAEGAEGVEGVGVDGREGATSGTSVAAVTYGSSGDAGEVELLLPRP
jgi:drug/metabolite transporter (DMT)-like permease